MRSLCSACVNGLYVLIAPVLVALTGGVASVWLFLTKITTEQNPPNAEHQDDSDGGRTESWTTSNPLTLQMRSIPVIRIFKAQLAVYAENAFAMGPWIDRSTTGRC